MPRVTAHVGLGFDLQDLGFESQDLAKGDPLGHADGRHAARLVGAAAQERCCEQAEHCARWRAAYRPLLPSRARVRATTAPGEFSGQVLTVRYPLSHPKQVLGVRVLVGFEPSWVVARPVVELGAVYAAVAAE